MMQVDAHVIPPPQIEYGPGQNNPFDKKTQSKWNNKKKKFFETRTPSNFKWAFINASFELTKNQVERIRKELVNVSKSHDLNLNEPHLDIDIELSKENLKQFFLPPEEVCPTFCFFPFYLF